jgi:hypothetical protein
LTKLVLHLGLEKTGSKTLQKSIFALHPDIFYLGRNMRSGIPKGCRSTEIHELLSPMIWNHSEELKVAQVQQKYQRLILDQVKDESVVLGSWEILGNTATGSFAEMLQRIRSISDNLKLIVTLRNPLTWAGAEYLQGLQGHYLTGSKKNSFGERPYTDFDAWLENKTRKRGVDGWLTYAENIKYATSILGRRNVRVFVFEELKSDPNRYFTSIAQFLDIDVAAALDLSREVHFNKRLLNAEIAHMRNIDSSAEGRHRWVQQSRAERKEELRLQTSSDESDTSPAKVTLSDRWHLEIAHGTKEGNGWLSHEFGLDLQKYGYPL